MAVYTDQFGMVVQGGYYLTDERELTGRYEYGDGDGVAVDFTAVTFGVNYYVNGHATKLTADVGYAFDPTDPLWATAGAGWRADALGEDGQIVLRTRLQLLF